MALAKLIAELRKCLHIAFAGLDLFIKNDPVESLFTFDKLICQVKVCVGNKAKAMKMLHARLYDLEMAARTEAKQEVEASKQAIDFGSQVRNYVMHPYRLVKDVRTNHETGNLDAVLDGDLEPFVKAFLMQSPTSES